MIRSLPKTLRRELVPAPDTRPGDPGRLDGRRSGDLRDAVARELLGAARRARADDELDLDKLPPHLRITFRVMDGETRRGRGQGRRRTQARAPAPAAAPSPPGPPPLTRTGVTSWNFGAAAQGIRRRRGRLPALVDAGAEVDVRLFETEAAARRAMRAGTRRLVLLARPVARQRGRQAACPPREARAQRQPARLGRRHVRRLRQLRDRRADDEAGGPAWDADAFARLAAASAPGCTRPPTRWCTWAEETCGRRTTRGSPARDCAARSSARPRPTCGAQLAGLIYPAS